MTRLQKALVLRELHRLAEEIGGLTTGETHDVATAYRLAAAMVQGLETILANTDARGVNAVTGDCLC